MFRKTLILATLFATLLTPLSTALAKHKCNTAPYTNVMPSHVGLTFGMSAKNAKAALERLYGSRALVLNNGSEIKVKFFNHKQKIFDEIILITMNDVVIKMLWSYSNKFQDSLGGPRSSLETILGKLKEKIGVFTKADEVEKGAKFLWDTKDDLYLVLLGRDPYTIVLGFTCETLESQLKKKAQNSANLGF